MYTHGILKVISTLSIGVIVIAQPMLVCGWFSWVNRQIYRLKFRHVGQVKDCPGQVHRSKVKVKNCFL